MLYCLLYHLIDIMTFGAIIGSLKDKKKGYKKERKEKYPEMGFLGVHFFLRLRFHCTGVFT